MTLLVASFGGLPSLLLFSGVNSGGLYMSQSLEIPLTDRQRSKWGIFGALSAVGLKFLTQDLYWFLIAYNTRDSGTRIGIAITYFVSIIILSFVGAGFAKASRENVPIKLIAIAVAAPAMFTNASGGAKATFSSFFGVVTELVSPVSTAYAADGNAQWNAPTESSILNGVKIFFGVGKDQSRYRVVVGSFTNPEKAAPLVEKIKKEAPNLDVFVGQPQPNNPYYPVVIGGYLDYPNPVKLKDQVSQLDALKGINDIYLSPYPYR
jgi:SPOR domain